MYTVPARAGLSTDGTASQAAAPAVTVPASYYAERTTKNFGGMTPDNLHRQGSAHHVPVVAPAFGGGATHVRCDSAGLAQTLRIDILLTISGIPATLQSRQDSQFCEQYASCI